jgi:hypothetical protein
VHRCGGRAVRRVECDLLDVVEERVEPRTAEDPDVCVPGVRVQAVFASLFDGLSGFFGLDDESLPLLSPLLLDEPSLLEELESDEPPLDSEDAASLSGFGAVLVDVERLSLR